ncbi:hypothetical protein V5O48_019143 [Marasmius crinis-equi]|uniref:Uncharacterized protein n=1 Tax=Marasmius crinis-equi TaxID=585013 RepID=A0ABR3EJ97_9AGAR
MVFKRETPFSFLTNYYIETVYSSFQETLGGPIRTIQVPERARSTRVSSLVRLLVQWQRLEAIDVPADTAELLNMSVDVSTERGRQLAAAISRLRELLEQRQRLRLVLLQMLELYLVGNGRGRMGLSQVPESTASL